MSKISSKITMEEIFHEVGDISKWHWLNLMWLWFPSAAAGFILITFSFTGLIPPAFRCSHPCETANATFEAFGNASLFAKNSFQEIDYCSYLSIKDGEGINCDVSGLERNMDFKICNPSVDRIIYDDFERESTIVTEFNLVCKDNFKVALVGTIYMVGILIGSFFMGRFSDIFGRRKAILAGISIGAISQLIGGFSTSYEMFCAIRFCSAIGKYINYVSIGSSHNYKIINLQQVPWCFCLLSP